MLPGWLWTRPNEMHATTKIPKYIISFSPYVSIDIKNKRNDLKKVNNDKGSFVRGIQCTVTN